VIVTSVSQLSVAVGLAGLGTALHSIVISAGMPANIGGVISLTVMIWMPSDVFPQLSVATHLLVKIYESTQLPFALVCVYVIVTSVSQLSVAVGLAGLGTALHSTVISAGIPANTGGVISRTVMICMPSDVFPQLSVATHLLVKIYESTQLPFALVCVYVIVTSVSQLSVAVGLAGLGTALHSTVISAGIPANTGGVISRTVMIWMPSLVLPQLSVATHLLVNI
jgi:hypothetical protein